MKRILSILSFCFLVFLVLTVLALMTPALADDTGIQIIGGPEDTAETINMDDMKEGDTAQISGFGDITLVYTEFVDSIPTDVYIDSWSYSDGTIKESIDSGSKADFLRIRLHILNTQKKSFDFKEVFGDVLCVFGDDYQFGGWVRQERKRADRFWTMYPDAEQSYSIDPLYEGYFDVVVTLPNYVVESKEPLSVTFSIGDNEFTCNIRK